MKIRIQKILIAILFLSATHAAVAGPTDWAKKLDKWIFGYIETTHSLTGNTAGTDKLIGGLPFARAIRPTKSYARVALVISASGIIGYTAYKAYKHFTKPVDDDATEDKKEKTDVQ